MMAEFRPASQNCPIESRILFLSAEKRWQVRADGVRWGHFSVAVCVDRICSPFGIVAVISLAPAGCMLSQFEASHKKRLVHPEWDMASEFLKVLQCVWLIKFLYLLFTHTLPLCHLF